MKAKQIENKKAILFASNLLGVGGAERLLLEEAKNFRKNGYETKILTFDYDEATLFNGTYDKNMINQIGYKIQQRGLFALVINRIRNIIFLRKKLREANPDIILSSSIWDCTILYYATLLTSLNYSTHIHGTIFWFHTDLQKYALIHKNVFNEIRESVAGHKEFIPIKPSDAGLIGYVLKELLAVEACLSVRKAKKIFVLSNQMKWEVYKLYGKGAIVLKGAFPKEILSYKPKQDIKKELGLTNKRIILNVNRLDKRKRIDLLIKAFKLIHDENRDVILIIGGTGPEEQNLRDLSKKLDLLDYVIFAGYIKEEELWDYIIACDVFVHPNWADFAIAAYEPLALQKKVVWSTEMEIDKHLSSNRHIFPAEPTVEAFKRAIIKALNTDIQERNDMSSYTWDRYCDEILKELIRC